jgi:hypothetical protein
MMQVTNVMSHKILLELKLTHPAEKVNLMEITTRIRWSILSSL